MTAEDLAHPDEAASTAEAPPRLWVPADGGVTAAGSRARSGVSRRMVLRLGAVGAAGVALTAAGGWPSLPCRAGLAFPDGVFAAASTAIDDLVYIEAFPTSPLILTPFTDPLPIPKALAPVPVSTVAWAQPPGPGPGQQNGYRAQLRTD